MAKKINDTETTTPEVTPDMTITDQSNGEKGLAEDVTAPDPEPASKKEINKPQEKKKPEIPSYADRLLRTFSAYPSLYIDTQGGTFTSATAPAFRSDATLYDNPYYKKSN